MHRRRSAAAARVFEDFDPDVEWKLAGEEQDMVEISLPGFRKDQVRVQVDNHGVLRATGECPTRGGRWARFMKDLQLPDNCDADGVHARFEGEKLIITLPIVAATSSPPPQSPSPTPSPPPRRPSPPEPSIPAPEPPRPRRPSPSPPIPSPTRPLTYPSPPPPGSPDAEKLIKAGTEEPKPSPGAAPGPKTPPSWQTVVLVSPPPPEQLPLPVADEPPKKKQLQDTSSMVPEKESERTKRAEKTGGGVKGKLDEAGRGGSETRSEKNRAQELPAVGDALTTTTTPPTPEPGRQLLVNAAAAVAVLVGVIVAVRRTLQS